MKFRKKPVVIDAVQVKRMLLSEPALWPAWLADAWEGGSIRPASEVGVAPVEIVTLEGVMAAGINDWIIRGVKGELYPCKPDIFEATYDPVLTSQPPDLCCGGGVSAGRWRAAGWPVRDTEPLLAHLRAQRDEALAAYDRAAGWVPEAQTWHAGRVAAYERAIIAIVRWERGDPPDPGEPNTVRPVAAREG